MTILTIHPDDGAKFGLPDGAIVRLETGMGVTTIDLAYDDRMHQGTASVPNGHGMSFTDEEGNELPSGVYVNKLTNPQYRDRFAGTPFHKFVPARIVLAR